MTGVRREEGFSLTEVLVAMLITSVVLGGILSVFETFIKQTRRVELRAGAQDTQRRVVDDISRTLRNQVGQTSGGNVQLERSGANDVIFRAFDPAAAAGNTSGLRRVRYCLDATTPADGKLVRQLQTWSGAAMPAMPGDTACPGTGWSTTTTLATGVTNARGGLARALWTYTTVTDGSVTTTTGLTASVWLQVDPKTAASEVNLTTAVALRNANRPPVAAFTVSRQNGAVILNAAAAVDPEGQALRYSWTIDGTFAGSAARIESALTSTATVALQVTDSGNLTATKTESVTP